MSSVRSQDLKTSLELIEKFKNNKLVNKVARKGSPTIFIEPEPGLAITKTAIRGAMAE